MTPTLTHGMADDQAPRFYDLLNEMQMFFEHELHPQKRTQYWRLLCEWISLDEWEYAVREAMRRETFFKVPLPGQLMDYVQEYRLRGDASWLV